MIKKLMLTLVISIMMISCGSKNKTEELAASGKPVQESKDQKVDKKANNEIQKVLESYNFIYNNEKKEYDLEVNQSEYDKFTAETFKIKETKFSEKNGLKEYIIKESCLTLCNPMNCSPPGSSAHGILQARILKWVAILFSRGSS